MSIGLCPLFFQNSFGTAQHKANAVRIPVLQRLLNVVAAGQRMFLLCAKRSPAESNFQLAVVQMLDAPAAANRNYRDLRFEGASGAIRYRSVFYSVGGNRETDERALRADTKRGVLKGLSRAEEAIRAQYFVAYRPAQLVRDGRFRSVRIRTVRDGFRVRCRRGYYADPSAPPK